MNNIICAKWGTPYGPEYVNIMYSMVERNISTPFRFICLTDDPTGIREEVDIKLLDGDLRGWWTKIAFFQSPLYDVEGPVLSIDLDMVIVDSIDCLFDYKPDSFCMKWDYKGHGHSSCVMKFNAGEYGHIYDNLEYNNVDFAEHNTIPNFKNRKYWGDQAWITEQMEGQVELWPKAWVQKFAKECHRDPISKRTVEERNERNAHLLDYNKEEFFIPEGCKVIAFSGIHQRNEKELHKIGKWWTE